MVNPAELVDALVDFLRDIPDLVEALGGDAQRISAYHDRYPKNTSLERARNESLHPSILVAYGGTADTGGIDGWSTELTLLLRAGEELGEATPDGYYQLFRQIIKGVPATKGETGVAMNNQTVHASFHPMERPVLRRQTDQTGVDYFEAILTFREIGDD